MTAVSAVTSGWRVLGVRMETACRHGGSRCKYFIEISNLGQPTRVSPFLARNVGGNNNTTRQNIVFKKYNGLQIREGTHLARVREQKLALVKKGTNIRPHKRVEISWNITEF